MQIEEIVIKVRMLEDLNFKSALEKVAKISQLMLSKSEKMKQEHTEKHYKLYCFSSLMPTETNGIYGKGKEYFFKIRTLRDEMKKLFLYSNEGLSNGSMVILGTQLNRVEIDVIDKIIVKNPVVYATSKTEFLTRDSGSLKYVDALHRNVQKKAERFYSIKNDTEAYGETPLSKDNFIKDIIFREKKSQICYKGTRLIAEKFALLVKDDKDSQVLAYIAIMTGLGQKNSSMGAGFVDFY